MRMLLMVGMVWVVCASTACAEMIFEYDANQFFTDPYFQNWSPMGGTGVEVMDQGQKSWQTSNLARYHRTIDSQDVQLGVTNGWRFKAEARLVGGLPDATGLGASGLAVYLNNRAYPILFALGTNGALQAKEFDFSPPTELTPANMGTAAYHDIELRWNPSRQKVEFWFDDVYRRDISGFNDGGHTPLARFGQISTALTTMNFRKVSFEVAPYDALPEQLGDYNSDGSVDAADYTLWRNTLGQTVAAPYAGADGDGNRVISKEDYLVWKRHYHQDAPAGLEAAAQRVPEPPLGLVALAAMVALRAFRRR